MVLTNLLRGRQMRNMGNMGTGKYGQEIWGNMGEIWGQGNMGTDGTFT
jgi:hypothetical protein